MRGVSAIIVAAGEGRRFGGLKQFALIKGKTVLDWCLENFETHEDVLEIILVLKNRNQEKKYLSRYHKISAIAKGGEKRQDSVLSGLNLVAPRKTDVVLVHDGVRPIVKKDLIHRVIFAAQKKGAAVPVVPIEETVKLIEKKRVLRTVENQTLFRAQTPQAFHYDVLKEAMDRAREENYFGTDEAFLVERMGREIVAVQGDRKNIKITTSEDLKIAELFLED